MSVSSTVCVFWSAMASTFSFFTNFDIISLLADEIPSIFRSHTLGHGPNICVEWFYKGLIKGCILLCLLLGISSLVVVLVILVVCLRIQGSSECLQAYVGRATCRLPPSSAGINWFYIYVFFMTRFNA